ncbi:MAG TPA: sugar transferase [Anaeromyxobacteraceae bacterium]|nr:sugar transferase [Anaeromyxobacteraceae bacterium]
MRNRVIEGGLRVLDLACLSLAMPLAYTIRDRLVDHSHGVMYPLSAYQPALALTLFLWLATSWLFQVYETFRTQSISAELWRIARSMVTLTLAVSASVFFLHGQQDVSRLFLGLFFAMALLLLSTNRLALRYAARELRRRGYNTRMFAVVGSGELAREVVDTVVAHPEWGLQFAGHILEDDAVREVARSLVLGRVSQLGQILDDNVIDEVVFAVPRERLSAVESAFYLCEEQGVGSRVCLDLFTEGPSRMSLGEMEGLPMLSFTRAPTDEVALAAKRVFDVASSALALLVAAPVLVAVAVGIKLESRGPVFFRQRRVGLNGRPFTMYKFRSMHMDAEARLESLRALNEAKGPVFKMRNDPRITRVGRFIRKTSLDELPQFFNVLLGEMSIVGPRPPVPAEVRQYKRWQRRRLSVKPGITCTWQVSGRSNIDFDQWMELDLDYIDNWSLWKDIQICFRTIPAVLSSRGAH